MTPAILMMMSGEIWFFVEGEGYLCKKGDLMRIPRGKVHWAYNCAHGTAVEARVRASH